MRRRKLAYLVLIAPLHYLALVIATLPAAYLLPPDLLQQTVLALPLFCVFLSWSVPALLRKMGFSTLSIKISRISLKSVLLAIVNLATVIAAVAYGIATTIEAPVLFAVFTVLGHLALLRKLT